MNAYTTMGQLRIQPRDVSAVLRVHQVTGAALAGLERQHACQATAELSWLLKQNAVMPKASTSPLALLRQVIGAALSRAGKRLASVPASDACSKAIK